MQEILQNKIMHFPKNKTNIVTKQIKITQVVRLLERTRFQTYATKKKHIFRSTTLITNEAKQQTNMDKNKKKERKGESPN